MKAKSLNSIQRVSIPSTVLTTFLIMIILFSFPNLLDPRKAWAADISETFSYPDGPIPNPWTVVGGVNGIDVKIARGKAVVGDASNGRAVYNQEFTDLDFEAEARNPRGEFYTGIMFRYVDSNNWYEAVFNPANDVVEVWKISQGSPILLIGTNIPVDTETLKLRVTMVGTLIVVYTDGRERLRVNDRDFSSGKIGLLAEANTRSEFDNLIVRDLLIKLQSFRVTVDGRDFVVFVKSNSTISNFRFDKAGKSISFSVSGKDGTKGFSEATFPSILINGTFAVTLDNSAIAFKVTQNSTHISISTTYGHSEKTLRITGTMVIPEFPFGVASALTLVAMVVLLTLMRGMERKGREGREKYAASTVL